VHQTASSQVPTLRRPDDEMLIMRASWLDDCYELSAASCLPNPSQPTRLGYSSYSPSCTPKYYTAHCRLPGQRDLRADRRQEQARALQGQQADTRAAGLTGEAGVHQCCVHPAVLSKAATLSGGYRGKTVRLNCCTCCNREHDVVIEVTASSSSCEQASNTDCCDVH
jgi:hypothetical protein